MKNRYSKSSKLSEARFRAVVKGFAADLTALQTAQLCGVNRNTVNRIYRGLRERIFIDCEAQRPFFGVVEVDESLLDAVTAVSGSGPAWFFRFVEALEKAAVDLGLSPEDAATLVRSTAAGAGQMMQGEDAPSTLRERVTTPGGTTAAGLNVFDQVLDALAQEALRAARDRGAELGRQ